MNSAMRREGIVTLQEEQPNTVVTAREICLLKSKKRLQIAIWRVSWQNLTLRNSMEVICQRWVGTSSIKQVSHSVGIRYSELERDFPSDFAGNFFRLADGTGKRDTTPINHPQ